MKLALAVCFALASTSAFAANTNALVKDLARYAYSSKSWKVKGKNAHEMLTDFALRISGMDKDEFKLVNFPREIPNAEESGVSETGLCKFPQAIDLIISEAESKNNGDLDRATVEKIWAAARKLKDAGLKFGYTTSGSSVCGVTWTDPLIIDEENNTIWEIFLVGGGC